MTYDDNGRRVTDGNIALSLFVDYVTDRTPLRWFTVDGGRWCYMNPYHDTALMLDRMSIYR